jgi:hypothetical protein
LPPFFVAIHSFIPKDQPIRVEWNAHNYPWFCGKREEIFLQTNYDNFTFKTAHKVITGFDFPKKIVRRELKKTKLFIDLLSNLQPASTIIHENSDFDDLHGCLVYKT